MNSVMVTYPYEKEFQGKRENDMRLRWRTRNATLKLLADLGIHPHVSVSEQPASNIHNRLNGVRAVKAATGPIVYFEDDIIPSKDLLDWLDACEQQSNIVQLCSPQDLYFPSWVREAVRRLEPIPQQFVPLDPRWGGAQALYLPERVTDFIRQDTEALQPNVKLGSFDAYVRTRFEGAVAAIPNPVQHVSPYSLVASRQYRVSDTFAHPTT